jgi:hypothetical protein
MNLFILDVNPEKCARAHCNNHIITQLKQINRLLGFVENSGRQGRQGRLPLLARERIAVEDMRVNPAFHVYIASVGVELGNLLDYAAVPRVVSTRCFSYKTAACSRLRTSSGASFDRWAMSYPATRSLLPLNFLTKHNAHLIDAHRAYYSHILKKLDAPSYEGRARPSWLAS